MIFNLLNPFNLFKQYHLLGKPRGGHLIFNYCPEGGGLIFGWFGSLEVRFKHTPARLTRNSLIAAGIRGGRA